MSSTIEFKNYSITTSLNERNIYIKCIDTINFTNYEGNLDAKELRLQFELPDIYNLIIKCFENEPEFTVQFNVTATNLKLTFNTKIGGFLKVNFEAILREKILSNDGQLTMNLNKIEQKYESLIKKLEALDNKMEKQQQENIRLINAISNAEIILSPHNGGANKGIFSGHIYKINSKSIVVECAINRYNSNISFEEPCLDRICEFYQLEKLELNYYRHGSLTLMKNNTLKELKMQCQSEGHLTSIQGIDNIPELEKLEIYNAPGLKNIVDILTNKRHKINTIILANCKAVNVVELQTYCQVNNIKLNIS